MPPRQCAAADTSRGFPRLGRYIHRDSMTDETPDQPADAAVPEAPATRRGLFRKRGTDATATAPADEPVDTTAAPDAPAPADDTAEDAEPGDRTRPGVLRRRRRQLLGKYEQGIFDLGGLALELHRRGLLAEEVMRRKAAEVTDLRGQVDQVDERLEEIRAERGERRKSGKGATMTCPSCGARCKASANFCAECGAPLKTAEPTPVDASADQPTTVIADTSTQDTQVISDSDAQHTQVLPPVKVDE